MEDKKSMFVVPEKSYTDKARNIMNSPTYTLDFKKSELKRLREELKLSKKYDLLSQKLKDIADELIRCSDEDIIEGELYRVVKHIHELEDLFAMRS